MLSCNTQERTGGAIPEGGKESQEQVQTVGTEAAESEADDSKD